MRLGKAAGGKKDEKKAVKAEKKKEQKPEKEEKPKAKEPEAEMDEADAIVAAEKFTDPFDKLPKGTFNMDDFKRFYSNEDEAKSVPYFWEKFDKENYSIWYGEYKYNSELSKVFMSCNLITGKPKTDFCPFSLVGMAANLLTRGLPPTLR